MIFAEALIIFEKCRQLNIGCEIIFDRSENIKISVPKMSGGMPLTRVYQSRVEGFAEALDVTVEYHDTNLLIY